MEITWTENDVQSLLPTGERLVTAFPARYPTGPLPYFMLFRGCILALTEKNLLGFSYSKTTSKPDKLIFSVSRNAQSRVRRNGTNKLVALLKWVMKSIW